MGEHPVKAVLREIREETGIIGKEENLAFVSAYRVWPGEVVFVFTLKVPDVIFTSFPDKEHDAAIWVDLTSLTGNIPAIPLTEGVSFMARQLLRSPGIV